jgi:SAM-dependent methyltransferase
MNNSDKDIIIDRYRNRLDKFGPSIESLASGTIERRNIRFDLLSKVGDMNGAKVLDIGSGLGDFYGYLKENNIEVDYTGYDLSPDLVKLAADRFADAKFEVRDIQNDGIPERFDYIVSSQTFNFRLANENNVELVSSCLKLCYDNCNKGICFDFLTSYVDFKEEHLFYYSPEEMFSFAKSLTKRVSLSHDSRLYEFAIFLYPDFIGWNNKSH